MSESAIDVRELQSLLESEDFNLAATLVLRAIGPEMLGFLCGVLGDDEGDQVFAAFSERLWRALPKFEWRCKLRTWAYVLARRELGRYCKEKRRYEEGRVPISALREVIVEVRTRTTALIARQRQLTALRAELPENDRMLLILRVDRNMSWDDIALAFSDDPEVLPEDDRKREAARLRKRFQLVKQRLLDRVRQLTLT